MTDLIDFNYFRSKIRSGQSSYSQNPFLFAPNANICSFPQSFNKFVGKIHQNNIKRTQTYIFQVDQSKLFLTETFCNYRVKLLGMISVGGRIFSLRMQFYDDKGNKINAKSTHHRTLISNFVFDINAELQNYKLEYNPISGEFSFVFSVKNQFIDQGLVCELIQFALDSYFEQCQAHFYVLDLIEFINENQNQYLKNVHQDYVFVKRWILERRYQNLCFIRKFDFYEKFLHILKKQLEINNQPLGPKQYNSKIKTIQKYLFPQSKKYNVENDFYIHKIHQNNKRFKKYFKEQDIFANHLTNKIKHQNYLNISLRNSKTVQDFFFRKSTTKQSLIEELRSLKKIIKPLTQNNNETNQKFIYQNLQKEELKSQKSQGNEQKISIWDKNTNKSYCVKIIPIKNNLNSQKIILQKLCKFQSYLFFNQYFYLQELKDIQDKYIIVNVNPKRMILSEFFLKNDKIVSFSSKIDICVNLVQIVLTLHLKCKILNYFPQISPKNLQITRKLSLSFKVLSKISAYPLLQLINTINSIFFQNSLTNFDKPPSIASDIVKGDQVQNKYWGFSIFITFLKFYLLELQKDAIDIIKLKQLKQNKKINVNDSQQADQWARYRLTRACQQLLVILCHFQNMFSRGYDQQLNFEGQSDLQD